MVQTQDNFQPIHMTFDAPRMQLRRKQPKLQSNSRFQNRLWNKVDMVSKYGENGNHAIYL